jgi:aminopeptidase N
MEYPTLFTAGTRWWITDAVTLETPEEVVIHEAGHQFWYGIVGSNEFEHAWMDEGINEFATARTLEADYPRVHLARYLFGGFVPWVFRDVVLNRAVDLNGLFQYRRGATEDTLARDSFRQRPRTVYTFAYFKPAAWLTTLERWLGWPVVQRSLSASFADGRFSHPAPEVVLGHLEQESGRDLTRFFQQTYYGSAVFDYSVDSLSSERNGNQFVTRVVVRRLQDGVFPVRVRVTFDNGEQVDELWDGEARWHEFTYTRPTRARSAVVDPDRQLVLDMNFTNNSRTLAPRAPAAAVKWSLKWMVWLQDALLTWGLLV